MTTYRKSFISHAHADNTLCDPYAEALTHLGAPHYYDREDPQVGKSLPFALQERIQEANVLIVMVSPASLKSGWVDQEIAMFLHLWSKDQSRMLIPVTIEHCVLPPILGHWWGIDATILSREEVVAQLASALELNSPQTSETLRPADDVSSDTELLIELDPPIPYHGVELNVYKECSLDLLDEFSERALKNYNTFRKNQGLIRFYPGVVYRVLRPPTLAHDNGKRLQVDLSILNFAYYALLKADSVEQRDKDHVKDKIAEVADRIPVELHGDHPSINRYSATPMGIVMVLITQDDFTLLRRRGKSVLEGPMKWEASFGGYCEVGNVEGDVLSIRSVADMELEEELAGTLPRNPRGLSFTGVCRNIRSGAIDILGYWRLDATARQLVEVINSKHQAEILRELESTGKAHFETTSKARDEFVHDYHNLLVKCETTIIEETLQQAEISRSSLIPEARMALDLALQSNGQRRLRLEPVMSVRVGGSTGAASSR